MRVGEVIAKIVPTDPIQVISAWGEELYKGYVGLLKDKPWLNEEVRYIERHTTVHPKKYEGRWKQNKVLLDRIDNDKTPDFDFKDMEMHIYIRLVLEG